MLELTADCARCAALCCRLSFFERSEEFAFTKQAGEPCRHLCGNACSIHSQRVERGFPGCLAFDCFGAGQAFTARLRGDEPLGVKVDAFAALVAIHLRLRVVRSPDARRVLLRLAALGPEELARTRARLLRAQARSQRQNVRNPGK